MEDVEEVEEFLEWNGESTADESTAEETLGSGPGAAGSGMGSSTTNDAAAARSGFAPDGSGQTSGDTGGTY